MELVRTVGGEFCFTCDQFETPDDAVRFLGLRKDDFYILVNGRLAPDTQQLQHGQICHLVPRIFGGKGGFGSMLRAIGAQIEKTTSREACRDLSGRRVRDVNNEKKLKEWVAKQAEREREKEERRRLRREKREQLLAGPQPKLDDPEYHEQYAKAQEELEKALREGLQRAKEKGKKRKCDGTDGGPSAKRLEWLGTGINPEDLDSDSSADSSSGASAGAGPSTSGMPSTSKASATVTSASLLSTDEDSNSFSNSGFGFMVVKPEPTDENSSAYTSDTNSNMAEQRVEIKREKAEYSGFEVVKQEPAEEQTSESNSGTDESNTDKTKQKTDVKQENGETSVDSDNSQATAQSGAAVLNGGTAVMNSASIGAGTVAAGNGQQHASLFPSLPPPTNVPTVGTEQSQSKGMCKSDSIQLDFEGTALFVDLLEAHPCLWNPRDKDSKDKVAKRNARIAIAEAMGIGWGEDQVDRKIQSLRGMYNNQKRAIYQHQKVGSVNGKPLRIWPLFERMASFMRHAELESNPTWTRRDPVIDLADLSSSQTFPSPASDVMALPQIGDRYPLTTHTMPAPSVSQWSGTEAPEASPVVSALSKPNPSEVAFPMMLNKAAPLSSQTDANSPSLTSRPAGLLVRESERVSTNETDTSMNTLPVTQPAYSWQQGKSVTQCNEQQNASLSEEPEEEFTLEERQTASLPMDAVEEAAVPHAGKQQSQIVRPDDHRASTHRNKRRTASQPMDPLEEAALKLTKKLTEESQSVKQNVHHTFCMYMADLFGKIKSKRTVLRLQKEIANKLHDAVLAEMSD